MKKTLIVAGVAALMTTSAMAQSIGVSMARFDDNFLTTLRTGMEEHAATLDGVDIQVEDAQDDVAAQLDQINNFIASGVDAIVVNAVDTNAVDAISKAAEDAGVPLVYVNREPANVDSLPDNQAFVASNEIESGTLAAFEACKMLRSMGYAGGAKGYMLMGQLSNQAAVQRSKDVEDIIGIDMCNFITLIDKQTANWSRDEASDLMTNFISAGDEFQVVFANNDEMALGAIQALKAADYDMADIVVVGVDATQDALQALQAGDLDATVFQDAAGQGAGAVDAALALANGEDVDQKVYIPFQLVTEANVDNFTSKN